MRDIEADLERFDDIIEQSVRDTGRRGPGRPPTEVDMSFERELTEADLQEVIRPAPFEQNITQKLRASHMLIAKAVAEGKNDRQIATQLGMSPSRVYTLRHNPAFQELVEHYQSELDEIYLDAHMKMAVLATDMVEIVAERLEDDPDDFTTAELVNYAGKFYDRTIAPSKVQGNGFAIGPAQNAAPVNLVVNFVDPQGKLPDPTPITIEHDNASEED